MAKALAPLAGHAALFRFDKLCPRRNLNKARSDAAPEGQYSPRLYWLILFRPTARFFKIYLVSSTVI